MSRYRSSFDLASAIAAAVSLRPPEETRAPTFRGVSLVSFEAPHFGPGRDAVDETLPGPPPIAPSPSLSPSPMRPSLSPEGGPNDEPGSSIETTRRPPKLPDLASVLSPVTRCEKIIEWIVEATSASNVFLSDAGGMPIAGAVSEAEARIAGSGLVAMAVTQLAASIPGNTSSLFELHIGEGPFFQLIGFEVGSLLYLVGLTRATPLTPRQAHAVRLACRHALGDATVGNV